MSMIRWLRMSESFAKLGHRVDVIVNANPITQERASRLRFVPWSAARWQNYDVIKTNYHRGFDALAEAGADRHPFIISRLGSVVARQDNGAGACFFGEELEVLCKLQDRIRNQSRVVAVLTEAEKDLWREQFESPAHVLVVPTGVDEMIPKPKTSPYARFREKIAVYIGNLRGSLRRYATIDNGTVEVTTQQELNIMWQNRLNELGRALKETGIRLCFVGTGATDKLDRRLVTILGAVDHEKIWDYHFFADVGIALAQGPSQIHECSKLYYYLRAGLPVVSETPIPTNYLIHQTGLGLIAEYGNNQMMAEMACEAVHRKWPTEDAIRLMLSRHTWTDRAKVYTDFMQTDLKR